MATIEDLKKVVVDAVRLFLDFDGELLKLEAHEQSISHRIAVHVEKVVAKHEALNVDCEYNKHLDDYRYGHFDRQYFLKVDELYPGCDCWSCKLMRKDEPPTAKRFRPDIIVHSRGNDVRNRIAIEIKQKKVCPFDLTKLYALTRPRNDKADYGYSLGAFIYFPDATPTYIWLTEESGDEPSAE